MVADVEYDFTLALRKGQSYLGQATIRFKYTPIADADLYVNFSVEALGDLRVNGVSVPHNAGQDWYINHRLNLHHASIAPLLKPGQVNTIELSYYQDYNTNRVGLHSFQD